MQEEEEAEEEEEEEEAAPKKKKARGWGSNYLKPALATFMNADSCPRSDVVKEIWRHTKEHDLQDPKDKRFIVCDERLFALFQKKRIHMFKMNKELTKHFGEKVGSAAAAPEEDEEDGGGGGDDDEDGSGDDDGGSSRKRKGGRLALQPPSFRRCARAVLMAPGVGPRLGPSPTAECCRHLTLSAGSLTHARMHHYTHTHTHTHTSPLISPPARASPPSCRAWR